MRISNWGTAALLSVVSLFSTASADDSSLPEGYKSVPLRTHSIYAPYLDSDLQSRWFDWGGDTIIRADQYIRLTSDRQAQSGFLWSRLPLTATNWEIEVEFKITGKGNLFGDGMAIWITKQRATSGPVFGSIDKFEGLGVFVDTYKNNRPGVIFPYVMAMLGDGNKAYEHHNDGKDQELAGCSARGIRASNIPTKAKLTYFQDKYLQLDLQYKTEGVWVRCFKVDNVKLPQVAYLGVTAATGELSDNHDVISISSRNLYLGTPSSATETASTKNMKKPYKKKAEKSGSSWSWFFFKTIVFFGIVVGGFVGYNRYKQQQKRARW